MFFNVSFTHWKANEPHAANKDSMSREEQLRVEAEIRNKENELQERQSRENGRAQNTQKTKSVHLAQKRTEKTESVHLA